MVKILYVYKNKPLLHTSKLVNLEEVKFLSQFQKRSPQDTSLSMQDIVQNQGYYDINGCWNSILTFDKYPEMIFRGRVEVFIFNRKNEVYMSIYNGGYRIPGGSFEKGRSHKYQVETEAKEEARIELGKIEYTGYSYFRFFKNKYTHCPIHWDGTYNEVYIGHFKSWYKGNIDKNLRDYFLTRYGRFIPFEYAVNILSLDHQKALNLIPH